MQQWEENGMTKFLAGAGALAAACPSSKYLRHARP
jgi:hypothetical protein